MKYKVIIAPNSSNPVTVQLKNNTNYSQLDVIEIPNIEGEFEVRTVDSVNKIYYVMPKV